jgi:hypothetical protein
MSWGESSESGDSGDSGSSGEVKTAAKEADKTPSDAGSEADKGSPGKRTWSFGGYVRLNVVPAFMLKLFTDLAPSPTNAAFGVIATYRTDDGSPNFEMGLGYSGYGFHSPFRTKGGDANDTEWWDSNLGLVHLTGSILWEAKLVGDMLGLQYGVGMDLGVVTGSLKRTEAYLGTDGAWHKCVGPLAPDPLYCQAPLSGSAGPGATDPYNVKGEQYNVTQKNIPPVMAFPMLPRLGLRFSPIPDFWARLDMAYGIFQFWFGLSVAYVPKM